MAVLALALFAVGAVVVDLGTVYVRIRVADGAAEQAAVAAAEQLPDPCAAQAQAWLSLTDPENAVVDDDPDAGPLTQADLVDGDLLNGELDIYDLEGDPLPKPYGPACGPGGVRVRVIGPTSTVAFGLARAFSSTSTQVRGLASAEVRSPLPILPFALPEECSGPGPKSLAVRPPDSQAAPSAVPVDYAQLVAGGAPVGVDDALLRTESVALTAAPAVQATVSGARVSAWWRLEFTAVLDGVVTRVVTSDREFEVDFPDPPDVTVALPVPAVVGASEGTWTVRAGRELTGSDAGVPPEAIEEIDGVDYIWSTSLAQLAVTTSPSPAALCDGSGPFGDLVLLDVPDPGSAVEAGIDGVLVPGDTVTLSTPAGQRGEADDVQAGALQRLADPGPSCPAGGGYTRPASSFLGQTLAETNDLYCYVATYDPLGGVWSIGAPDVARDPRVGLIPVVDVASLLWPGTATDVLVVGYRLAVLTDETAASSVSPTGGPADCPTVDADGACGGLVALGGVLDRATVLVDDPAALPDDPLRLLDNGRPWLAGPRDVQVVG
jgi:hypothetical protein